MKTDIGNYYIIFSYNDFVKIYTKYLDKGYNSIYESDLPNLPKNSLKNEKTTIVLNCVKSDKTMIYGVVDEKNLSFYMENEDFSNLYKKELRKIKFKRLNTLKKK